MNKQLKTKSIKKGLSPEGKAMIESLHTNDDVKRYIGAVTEHFEHGLAAVSEQYTGLSAKVDGLSEKVDGFAETVNDRFDHLEGRIDNIERDVAVIKVEVRKKANVDDVRVLSRRVLNLELKASRQ